MKIGKINIVFVMAIAFVAMGCGTKVPFQNIPDRVSASSQEAAGKPNFAQPAVHEVDTSSQVTCKINFSDKITCKKADSSDVVSDSMVKVGEKLIFTAKTEGIPTEWSTTPSAWAVWKSDPWTSDDDKKYTLNVCNGTNSTSFEYVVKNSDICTEKDGIRFIDITFLVKSEKETINVLSPLGHENLTGIDVENGLPHEFFYDNTHKTAKKFKSYINTQKGTLDWREYSFNKEVIADEAEDADISVFKDKTDLKVFYYGQKSRTNSMCYELQFLSRNESKITDVYELVLKHKHSNNLDKLVINAKVINDNSGKRYVCNENDPDGEIYLIQGKKAYRLGVDGLHKDQIDKLKNDDKLKAEIDKISKNELKDAFSLKDKNDRDSVIKKVKAVHDYLIETVEFGFTPYCRSAYGAIVDKKAVCAGYAIGFQRLLKELKVDCEYITGYTDSGEFHAWNVVNLGIYKADTDSSGTKEYYQVDVTWDDAPLANGSYKGGFFNGVEMNDRRYKYFLKSTHYMKANRHGDAVTALGYNCEQTTYDSIEIQNKWKWKELQVANR